MEQMLLIFTEVLEAGEIKACPERREWLPRGHRNNRP